MNKKRFALTLLAVISCGLSVGAHADGQGGGSLRFTGSVIAAPCSISAETADQVIDFGSVSSATLNGIKDGGPGTGLGMVSKTFTIKLEGCTYTGNAPSVQASFSSHQLNAANATLSGNSAIGSAASLAKGTYVSIVPENGTPIPLDNSVKTTLQKLNASGSDTTMNFTAQMKGNGTESVTPGKFETIVDFTLNYQ